MTVSENITKQMFVPKNIVSPKNEQYEQYIGIKCYISVTFSFCFSSQTHDHLSWKYADKKRKY